MSVWQKLWKSKSNGSKKEIPIEETGDHQPCNPFSEVLILQHHTDIVRHLLVLDERRCVSAGDDNVAVIWEYQLCMKLNVLIGHTRPITCLLQLTTGTNGSDWLLTGSSDKHIKIWDIDDGQCLQDLIEHGTSVKCLIPMGETMFVSGGQMLHLWSNAGKLCHSYPRQGEEADVCIMMLTRHDRFITAADKKLVVYQRREILLDEDSSWEIKCIRALPSHREAIRIVTLVTDTLFASGSIDGTILLWSSQTFVPIVTLNTVTDYKGIDNLFPYSVQHIIVENERYLVAAVGCGFVLFDINLKKILCKKLNAHYSKVIHLTFVCDGSFLATCSEDGSMRLWGAQTYIPFHDHEDKANMALGVIERFLDLSPDQLRQVQNELSEPVLLGDCLAHCGVVQKVIDCGLEGILSCGDDGLVIAWKNSELQNLKRNRIVQEEVLDPSGVV